MSDGSLAATVFRISLALSGVNVSIVSCCRKRICQYPILFLRNVRHLIFEASESAVILKLLFIWYEYSSYLDFGTLPWVLPPHCG